VCFPLGRDLSLKYYTGKLLLRLIYMHFILHFAILTEQACVVVMF
jgi:hypothetical protein